MAPSVLADKRFTKERGGQDHVPAICVFPSAKILNLWPGDVKRQKTTPSDRVEHIIRGKHLGVPAFHFPAHFATLQACDNLGWSAE